MNFRLSIYIVILSALFGCSTSRSDYKVGLLMDSFVHERWNTDLKLLKNEFKDHSIEVILRKAEGSAQLQIQQAEDVLAQGVDALVIVAVDQNKASEIVRMANEKSVPVIAYDRLVKNCELDYYVSFDHVDVGRQQALSMIENVDKPNVFIVGGAISDNNAFMISAGQNAVIDPYRQRGTVAVKANVFTAHWLKDEAFNLAVTVFSKHPDVNAVLAANDAIAEGVADAADSVNVQELFITGMDADSSALIRVKEGRQSMTIYKPLTDLATITAHLTLDICAKDSIAIAKRKFVDVNNGMRSVSSILIPSIIVDSSNVQFMLDQLD